MVSQTPRQGYVTTVSGGSPLSSEKGIHWRGTLPHACGYSHLRGPCGIGLLHSPCVSLDNIEQRP